MRRLSTLDYRRRRRGRGRDDRGATLIELIVAVSILSTAVIALTGGIAVSIRVSDIHRKQASAGSYVRAFAEAVSSKVAQSPTGYAACTAGTTPAAIYEAAYVNPNPAAYQANVTAVAFWNSATSTFVTCPASGDAGVQRVSLRVQSLDGRASETLDVVIRKPCRAGDGCT
jgi:type II secretory pathway pseudopilin PulG